MNEESLARLRQRNLDSAGDWKRYASHRRQATRLIVDAASTPAGKLCLLGAGNCNDVELSTLLRAFSEIHLVDLDRNAVEAGLNRQGEKPSRKIVLHAPVDFDSDDVAAALPEAGSFDAVASICVLSQLIDAAPRQDLSAEQVVTAVQQIRERHFQLLTQLAGSQGNIVVANEAVSTDSAPQIATCEDHLLGPQLVELAMSQQLFMGLNPAVIALELQKLAPSHRLLTSPPWRWDFGPRTYAVCGHSLKRPA